MGEGRISVTIKHIADNLGVSAATVSRALNGVTTRSKVGKQIRAEATRLGYQVNRTARRLRTGKTELIGYILDQSDASDSHTRQLMMGVAQRLAQNHHHLIIITESQDDPLSPLQEACERRTVDGLVVTHTFAGDPRIDYLLQSKTPFVTHGRTAFPKLHGSVDFAHEIYSLDAVRILIRRGHTKIALILPPEDLIYRDHLYQGYQLGLQDAGLTCGPVFQAKPPADLKAYYRWARDNADQFTGVILYQETVVDPLVAGLESTGAVVGQTHDVVTKTLNRLTNYQNSSLIICPENLYEAGTIIAQKLLEIIEGHSPGDPYLQMPNFGWDQSSFPQSNRQEIST